MSGSRCNSEPNPAGQQGVCHPWRAFASVSFYTARSLE